MLPEAIFEDVKRYLSYGWEWPMICKLINRMYGETHQKNQLKRLYEAQNREGEEGR